MNDSYEGKVANEINIYECTNYICSVATQRVASTEDYQQSVSNWRRIVILAIERLFTFLSSVASRRIFLSNILKKFIDSRERERERSECVMRRNPGSSFYFENCWATLGKLRGRISERLARMKLPVSAATNFSRGNVHNNRRAHKRVGKRASEKRNGVCCTVGVALTFVPSPFLCARVQPAPFHRRGSHLIPPRLR